MTDKGQTYGHRNMADRLSDGHGDAMDGIRLMVVGVWC